MIELGMLIEYVRDDLAASLIVRVLYVDIFGTNAAVIDVDSRAAEPVWNKVADLEQSLATKEARVLQTDHVRPPTILENELSEEERQFRAGAWASIEPLFMGENKVLMLYPRDRARLVRQRAEEICVTRKTLYKRARRYWQGGQTPNTQLSHYRNCGTNKDRKITKKLGRPSLLALNDNRVLGVNVDADLKDIIVKGGILFYENQHTTLEEAYRKTIARFCNIGYEPSCGDNIRIPKLPPVEKLFTIGQFKYWYQRDADRRLRRAIVSRHGERRVNLRHREVLGSSTKEAMGPYSLFQVDATLADVYLVSRRDRSHIIGRPVIHVIIDVFSRMVVGLSVRPEHEGWFGLMLAIENTTVDKAAFCAQYGVMIDEKRWPVSCFPERLLGDRGALEGASADHLVNSLNLTIENTPPYRADWKGIVEQFFNKLNIKFIHGVPGAVDWKHERGDRDYRLDAVLDIYEFTQMLLEVIIHHNNENRMESYEMDEYMIRDKVEPYPIDLFRWGLENRQGRPRTRDAELIRISLLPSDTATITESGIRFRGLFYLCEQAIREDWFLRARDNGRTEIRAAYDPRTTNFIFLRPEGDRESITCHLKDQDSPFRNCDWIEVEGYSRNKKVGAQRARSRALQADVSMMARNDARIRTATEKTKRDSVPGQSKRERIGNILANRQEETRFLREADVKQLYSANSQTDDQIEQDLNDFEYIPFPQPSNVLSIRERMMKSDQKK
jgi:putative transposase